MSPPSRLRDSRSTSSIGDTPAVPGSRPCGVGANGTKESPASLGRWMVLPVAGSSFLAGCDRLGALRRAPTAAIGGPSPPGIANSADRGVTATFQPGLAFERDCFRWSRFQPAERMLLITCCGLFCGSCDLGVHCFRLTVIIRRSLCVNCCLVLSDGDAGLSAPPAVRRVMRECCPPITRSRAPGSLLRTRRDTPLLSAMPTEHECALTNRRSLVRAPKWSCPDQH